jgi:septal ring factor EnvC (AmiA/AmiB activator)
MEMQMECKKKELKEVREQKKKLLELQDKTASNYRMTSNLETQLDEMTKRLEVSHRERDKFERELVTTKSELAGIKRTLGILQIIRLYNKLISFHLSQSLSSMSINLIQIII